MDSTLVIKVLILGGLATLVASQGPHDVPTFFFRKLDQNNDDLVSLAELYVYFDNNDTNGDGIWTLSEYSGVAEGGEVPSDIRGRFSYYDSLDGQVDQLTQRSAIEVFFQTFDSNGDGEITLPEFITVWDQPESSAAKWTNSSGRPRKLQYTEWPDVLIPADDDDDDDD